MPEPSLEELCELGQRLLMETRYVEAEAALVRAEAEALTSPNWDVLSRLYMPLQEARRQRRQICGEGIVRLDILATGPSDRIDANQLIEQHPQGQLLVAGWGTIWPAVKLRRAIAERGLYLETFLAAVFPTIDAGRAVIIVPLPNTPLPNSTPRPSAELAASLASGSSLLRESELPRGPRKGTFETYGQVMELWERLHRPFLAAADAEKDLHRKIALYRRTIEVDPACELAHQNLSGVARELARQAIPA